ncbi:hypothetical protein TCAL_03059 [Tigriopus californicus]|uniref:Uncharacterized protein n=1 Tax=Tigriopus californicus TaxID=6832 RepID=A0A553NVS7_TIGCA|nr:uncharacterized protein LOC131887482 [Tigriopus californicus]TRY69524.1 hypothetical protein TCAL_03059 [Tigriopus californicus]
MIYMPIPPSSPRVGRHDPLPTEDWFQRLSRFHQDNQDHDWFTGSLDPVHDDSLNSPEEIVSWRVFGRHNGRRPPLKSLKSSARPAVARLEPVLSATGTPNLNPTDSITTVDSSITWPSSGASARDLGPLPTLSSGPLKVGKGRGARRQEIRAQIQATQPSPGMIGTTQENTDPNPPPGPVAGDTRPATRGLEACAALFSSPLPANHLPAPTQSLKEVKLGRGQGKRIKY